MQNPTNHTSYFTAATSYIRTRKWEFCTDACTFASKVFANDYLTKAQERVSIRLKELKGD